MALKDNKKLPQKNRTFIESFRYAFEGVRTAFQEERNMRSHVFSAVIVIILSYFLSLNLHEWLWILFACFAIIVMEILNTVVENIIDFISPGYHPLAKKVKDMAAAAVLFTSFFSMITGGIILVPKVLEVLKIYN